jgi:hypothetical protein
MKMKTSCGIAVTNVFPGMSNMALSTTAKAVIATATIRVLCVRAFASARSNACIGNRIASVTMMISSLPANPALLRASWFVSRRT